MKLFISWSGERSMFVATALRDWLKLVLQAVDPWMSQADLKAGTRWNPELEGELANAVFGVTCVTPENRDAPWLLFEAGALTTQVKEKAYLCPYLIELDTSDVDYPLAQFQMKKWDREGTLGLIQGINSALTEKEPKSAIPPANLEKLFEALWPQLEKQYAAIPKTDSKPAKVEKKDPAELMGETLEQTRDLGRQLIRIEEKLEALDTNIHAQSAHALFSFGQGAPVLGLPTGLSLGVPTTLGSMGLPISLGSTGESFDPKLFGRLNKAIEEYAEKKAVVKRQCPKCGATDKFRLAEPKRVNRSAQHHNETCGNCGTTVRQFHTVDSDKQNRERSCPRVCKFHLNIED